MPRHCVLAGEKWRSDDADAEFQLILHLDPSSQRTDECKQARGGGVLPGKCRLACHGCPQSLPNDTHIQHVLTA